MPPPFPATPPCQFRGDFLFAGTRPASAPFTVNKDAAGKITSVSYNGSDSLPAVEINAGSQISGQSLGANASGSGPRGLLGDSRVGADFFGHLLALRDNLRSGNITAIASTDRRALATDEENLLYHISDNGIVQSRLETAKSMTGQRLEGLRNQVSQETDADIAETLTQLSSTQTAFQAALQSGSTILHTSLLDYLR